MAEVNANSLTTKTTPGSNDNLLLFDGTSNEGSKIDYDELADAILGKLTTKTFANQVGGSSAATLLSQLSTLNSKLTPTWVSITGAAGTDATIHNNGANYCVKLGRLVLFSCAFDLTNAASLAHLLTFPSTVIPLSMEYCAAFDDTDKTINNVVVIKRSSGDGTRLEMYDGIRGHRYIVKLVYFSS